MSIAFNDIFPAEIVSVQGKPYLFTNERIIRRTIPEDFFSYEVRDECDGEFWEIQYGVMVNHWGTIIGKEEVSLDDHGQYWCMPEKDNPDISSEGASMGVTIWDADEYRSQYEELLNGGRRRRTK